MLFKCPTSPPWFSCHDDLLETKSPCVGSQKSRVSFSMLVEPSTKQAIQYILMCRFWKTQLTWCSASGLWVYTCILYVSISKQWDTSVACLMDRGQVLWFEASGFHATMEWVYYVHHWLVKCTVLVQTAHTCRVVYIVSQTFRISKSCAIKWLFQVFFLTL